MKKVSGFTLMEVLVVLVIMATFVALVAPRMVVISDDAKETANKVQISYLKTALKSHRSIYGTYPSMAEGLKALVKPPANPDSELNWKGPLLESDEVPKDPWGREYIYLYPGKNNPYGYDLYSLGKPSGE